MEIKSRKRYKGNRRRGIRKIAARTRNTAIKKEKRKKGNKMSINARMK